MQPTNPITTSCINYLANLINATYSEYNHQHPEKPLTLQPNIANELTILNNTQQYEQIYITLEDLGSNIIYNPAYWAIADLINALPAFTIPQTQTEYTFTQPQLLNILNNWGTYYTEPITPAEYEHLLKFITLTEIHTYGLNSPTDLLLEYLSDYEGE